MPGPIGEVSAWLTPTPAAGSLTTNETQITVTAIREGLMAGGYTGLVSFASLEASNSPQVVAVTMMVNGDGTLPVFANAGFESPSVGNSFIYNPTGAGWTFDTGSGISGNNSGFTAGASNAPQGAQVGFMGCWK